MTILKFLHISLLNDSEWFLKHRDKTALYKQYTLELYTVETDYCRMTNGRMVHMHLSMHTKDALIFI